MKSLRIGFSRPRSKFAILSFLIQKVQNTNFSHAFLRWTSKTLQRDLVYQASHGMVHFVSGDKFDQDTETMKEYEIELTDEQFNLVVQKCVDLAGVKYGVLQLIGMGLERLIGLPNPFKDGGKTYICSELVGEVLKVAAIDSGLDLEQAGPKELEAFISTLSNIERRK